MSDFHKEAEHTGFALLFDSHKIEEKFKNAVQIDYFVIKDKEENRITSMMATAQELGHSHIHYRNSALSAVAIARTYEEAVIMQTGLVPITPQGLNICTTCLAKAILACEEELAVLKDIQQAVKEYAAKL